jgi:inorganic pyrophosphatase
VLVLLDEPVALGCVVPVRLIGVLQAEQTETNGEKVRNNRLLGVVETSYNPAEVRALGELHPQRVEEIEHFFVSYNEMEGRRFRPTGRGGPDQAERLFEEGSRRAARAGRKAGGARGGKPPPARVDPHRITRLE